MRFEISPSISPSIPPKSSSPSPHAADRYSSQQRKNEDRVENTTIKTMIAAALIMMAVYLHLLRWGAYATEIPFMKLAQITGTLSKQGHIELAQACSDLGKWKCAKDTYSDLATVLHDPQGFAMRARLESRLGQTENAAESYAAYFAAGGKDFESFYYYGALLETLHRDNEALQAYENSVAHTGNQLPVKATNGIVRLLMKQGRNDEALARIQTFRASAENAIGYFNTELEQLTAGQPKQNQPKQKLVTR